VDSYFGSVFGEGLALPFLYKAENKIRLLCSINLTYRLLIYIFLLKT